MSRRHYRFDHFYDARERDFSRRLAHWVTGFFLLLGGVPMVYLGITGFDPTFAIGGFTLLALWVILSTGIVEFE